ncbi:MAG TPA: M48 family metalloprotease [Sphingomonadaceae bacterium]|nr:M48 family metalloprotease [Sphingomonadaceae bacterium]
MLRVNGFVGHVRRNDMLSLAMFAGFALAFQMIAAAVLFVPLLIFDTAHAPVLGNGAYFARYAWLMLLLSFGLFLIGFGLHSDQVRESVGFTIVDRRSHPRLVNIVEQMAIAAGLPAPKVGLIPSGARNAFACGHSRASATVVVTRGLVEALDDDELAAVIAHEITHIANGDIRLMAAANIMMGIVVRFEKLNILRVRDGKPSGCLVFMPAIMVLVMFAGALSKAALTLARVSRLLLSTSREYIADAEAVRLTHNPGALISVLRKIDGRSEVEGVDVAVDAMMIDGLVEGPYATHPSIAERIATLLALSGDMATSGGRRRDTRPLADIVEHRPAGGFGRKGLANRAEPIPPAPPPVIAPKLLTARVNKGEERNAWGLLPRQSRSLNNSALLFIVLPLVLSIIFIDMPNN